MELNCRETELKSKQLEVFVSHLACKDDYFYFYLVFYSSNFNLLTLSHLRSKRNLENQSTSRNQLTFEEYKSYLSGRTWHSAGHLGLQWVGVRSLGAVSSHLDSFSILIGGSSNRMT